MSRAFIYKEASVNFFEGNENEQDIFLALSYLKIGRNIVIQATIDI